MQKSPIQWTDATWNPVLGCRRVSAGCEHCYAERLIAVRFNKNPKLPMYHDIARVNANGEPRFTGAHRLLPDRLDEPLRARKGRKIFVCDMGDLFFEGHPFEEIAQVWAVMLCARQHTFQVLTKRPDRALEFMRWIEAEPERLIVGCERAGIEELRSGFGPMTMHASPRSTFGLSGGFPWPLVNVHVGVSVEDQAAADKRIPLLLQIPAALRFLSCEPLLETVDLSRWIAPHECCDGCGHVEPGLRRGGNGAPVDECVSCGDSLITAWGDVQVERWESRARYANGGPHPEDDGPQIKWMIGGGESGKGARPCDLAWLRNLRDQCKAAGVPWFCKQLGANARERVHGVLTERWTRDKHGGDMAEWPEDLRIRDAP